MTRTSLASIALLTVVMFSIASESQVDSLLDEMAALNARWDAAINDPNPDALLPMYSPDARLMPPGAPPATGPVAIRVFAARGKASETTSFSLWAYWQSGTTPTSLPNSPPYW